MPSLNPRQLANAPARAGILLIAGQMEQARALCEQVLAEAPPESPVQLQAFQMLARIARRQHDWSRALEALHAVLTLAPEEAAEWYERGLVYRSLAQWNAAIADMEQAVACCVNAEQRAHFAQGLQLTRREARAALKIMERGRRKPRR